MAVKRARSPSRPTATFLTFHYTKPLSIFTDSTRKATLSTTVLILTIQIIFTVKQMDKEQFKK